MLKTIQAWHVLALGGVAAICAAVAFFATGRPVTGAILAVFAVLDVAGCWASYTRRRVDE